MSKKLLAVLVSLLPLPVFARPPDFSSLTNSIDMSTTMEALLMAAAALLGLYILWTGANLIMSAFKGGN